MTRKRRVLVTGACGYIAQRIWAELTTRYEITALDASPHTATGQKVEDVIVCDLTDSNRSLYRKYFEGIDAVIHCAYRAAPGENGSNADITANTDAQFFAEHANLSMAYNVYRCATEAGVSIVVVASSNHAADYYERLIWEDRLEHVTPTMAPRSDNFYGWAKASYELLGFVFASGQCGERALEVVQLRIGAPRDHADLDHLRPGQLKEMHRGLGAHLSQRDQAQLFIKSVETPNIDDENGVPFQIFFGASGNTHNFWAIANARKVIGYEPQDNSQVQFAERISALAKNQR